MPMMTKALPHKLHSKYIMSVVRRPLSLIAYEVSSVLRLLSHNEVLKAHIIKSVASKLGQWSAENCSVTVADAAIQKIVWMRGVMSELGGAQ